MRIVIDLTSLSYHMTGIERYAACMTEEMLRADHKNEYALIFRNEIYPPFETFIDRGRVKAIVLHGRNKLLFLQLVLPIKLYGIKANKYIFFAFTSPALFKKKGIINTIHDMGAWDAADAMTTLQKIYWKTTFKISAKNSESIITVSEFSKGRINALLKVPKEKIDVIYSAVGEGVLRDDGCSFSSIKAKYKLPDKYVMTLSTLEPRKNLELLLSAFTKVKDNIDYDLVLVGRKGWKMEEVIKKYDTQDRIHITGYVDDKDVSLIYKNALCFVFPSLYEGFGLPPVEALSLGIPVIASNAASIPEILRQQATYFESGNLKQLCSLLITLTQRIQNMPNGLDNFQKENYSFTVSAQKILKLIEG